MGENVADVVKVLVDKALLIVDEAPFTDDAAAAASVPAVRDALPWIAVTALCPPAQAVIMDTASKIAAIVVLLFLMLFSLQCFRAPVSPAADNIQVAVPHADRVDHLFFLASFRVNIESILVSCALTFYSNCNYMSICF